MEVWNSIIYLENFSYVVRVRDLGGVVVRDKL